MKIPVARPLLPDRAAITAYLDEIDANRWYSNFGPLCLRFEARLAERFGLAPDRLTTVSNATVGLVVALQAASAKPGSHCLLPSWTFSASVHAVIAAGLVPLFVDVDEQGAMTPEIARQALTGVQAVGAAMPVAVYGQPMDPAPWERFQAETGVPVVIDAAPGFDSARPGALLSVVSLHATKILGVGEGGFTKIGELPAKDLPPAVAAPPPPFADVLARILGRKAEPKQPAESVDEDETR